MYETVKEADKEAVTNENIIPLTRDHTTLLKSDNVGDIGEINNSLMLESELPIKRSYDDNKMDGKVEIVEKRKYKQVVSEC